ncbi:MAG TPA: cell division protein FtsK, partial [Algoriphagus sp.]
MATNSPRTNTFRKKGENAKKAASTKSKGPKISLGGFKNSKFVLTLGIILMSAGIFLFIAFISYLLNGPADQSVVMNNDSEAIRESARESQNWLGFLGAQAGHWMIYRWFGVAAFLFPPFLFILGFRWTFKLSIISLTRYTSFALFFTFWLGLLTGYIVILVQGYSYWSFLSGGFGYELAKLSSDFLGWGTFILIGGALLIFVIFFFDIDKLDWFSLKNTGDDIPYEEDESEGSDDLAIKPSSKNEDPFALDDEEEIEDDGSSWTVKGNEGPIELSTEKTEEEDDLFNVPQVNLLDEIKEKKSEVVAEEKQFSVTKPVHEEKTAEEVENLDPYDPTLDLPRYKYPTLDLLNEYDLQKVTVTRQELEENKNKIVETLENFKIGIQEIKATIGPTVTLYEIVPEPGVKISKIKNLEDDIALSLAALGIRIIAPIPGKGTIGIEVPNKNRELVPARAVLGTEKFMRSDKDLPIALGKTISNEVFVVDLAKMPHLLMAGATGQGKSVGLNMILASLIYKKHPSQLKFVLVDPKKVELTLFNKIERHFLAKLPGSEEAIITDTKKVIYT